MLQGVGQPYRAEMQKAAVLGLFLWGWGVVGIVGLVTTILIIPLTYQNTYKLNIQRHKHLQ